LKCTQQRRQSRICKLERFCFERCAIGHAMQKGERRLASDATIGSRDIS
jgi:hypothetical protein